MVGGRKRCGSCSDTFCESGLCADARPAYTPMTPELEAFLAVLESHLARMRELGHRVRELHIGTTEAEELGIRDQDTTVFGIPIVRCGCMPFGQAALVLDVVRKYAFELPPPRIAIEPRQS